MLQSFVALDGTECPIQKSTPFSKHWFSHERNWAGLRCDLTVSVSTASAVWASEPWTPGWFSDVSIFRNGLKTRLGISEFIVADAGTLTVDVLHNQSIPILYH